jgi:hypothetical protein
VESSGKSEPLLEGSDKIGKAPSFKNHTQKKKIKNNQINNNQNK